MYLQLNTRFNPFTYDEMVKPLLYYKQAYDAAEAAYSDLTTQTDSLENIVDSDTGSRASERFHRYSDDLYNAVSDFSKGMTASNRSQLLNMKRRYAKEIQPIADANKRRTELAEEQRRLELQNPSMMWQRRASDMSLDEFLANPSADYGKSISGSTLAAQVSAGATALAKEFRDNPEKMRDVLGGDYYEYVKQRGFSSEAVLAAIMNDPNASPVLSNLVEGAISSSGVKDWADNNTLQKAYDYARQGLWSAVGQDETQLVQNWRAQQATFQAFQASENTKNRQLQIYMSRPRELVDENGNGTGTYYDPKLGMLVDENGNISSNQKNNPKDRTSYSTANKLTESLKKVSSVQNLQKLGYTPVFATARYDKESLGWVSGYNGADIPRHKTRIDQSSISKNGNFSYKVDKDAIVSIVDDFNRLPPKAVDEIMRQAESMGISLDEDIQILRVSGKGKRANDYDYIIFRNNSNL